MPLRRWGQLMDEQKITLLDLQRMKTKGLKITMLSINDYPMALMGDRAGLDTILVGDSLAMTVLGYETTVPVTMEEMLHHTKAVTRAVRRAFVVGDMPFMSNANETDAVANAGRFMKEAGTDAVKVEGGRDVAGIVSAINRAGIPVMGHLGLTPQHVSMLGGFKAQGREATKAKEIIDGAEAIQHAGAFAVILECVPDEVSAIITECLEIPTIGYGAGLHCDGQGLVAHDILGMFDRFTPRFVKKYANLNEEILQSFETYIREVKEEGFPTADHAFHMKDEELNKVIGER